MSETRNETAPAENTKLVGLLAQFDDPDSLVQACDQARQAGYKKMDAYSPFPVHGIDPAIGIRRTVLPFIVLFVGLGAVLVGLGMQFYTNGGNAFIFTDESPLFPGYRFMISGKPYFSLPANIPVTFEVIVLSSAFAAFLGMWALNKLPLLANPLHRISRFKRATNDRFFLVIEEKDDHFDRNETESQLNGWGATAIEEVRKDLSDTRLPGFVTTLAVLGLVLLMAPPVLIYRASGKTNRQPRLHVVPDMDWQEKYKTQTLGPNDGTAKAPQYLFADLRTMREPIPGTIARGNLAIDSEYHRGVKSGASVAVTPTTAVRTSLQEETPQDAEAADPPAAGQSADAAEPDWVDRFPAQVDVSADLLQRGQQRFNIYCSACHGYAGNGDGLVNQRGLALNATGEAAWTAAKSLHDPTVKEQAVGRIFDTISNGRGTMGPYRSQIPVADRWAIVAYVKALQATGIKPPATAEDATATDGKASSVSKTKP